MTRLKAYIKLIVIATPTLLTLSPSCYTVAYFNDTECDTNVKCFCSMVEISTPLPIAFGSGSVQLVITPNCCELDRQKNVVVDA